MLHDDSHHIGTADTPVCECGRATWQEKLQNTLLCCRFQEAQKDFSAEFLPGQFLVPYCSFTLTIYQRCAKILCRIAVCRRCQIIQTGFTRWGHADLQTAV